MHRKNKLKTMRLNLTKNNIKEKKLKNNLKF